MFLSSASRYYTGMFGDKWLKKESSKTIQGLLSSFCFGEFSMILQSTMPTLGDIFTPSFLTASQECRGGQGKCSNYQPWLHYMKNAEVGKIHLKTPTLLVQGENDLLVGASSVRCIANRLISNGSKVTQCSYPNANHATIVSSSWNKVLEWLKLAEQNKITSFIPCTKHSLPSCP